MIRTLLVLGTLCVAGQTSAETLRIGGLAPRSSHFGKVFSAWAKAVKKNTGGKLTIDWAFNGAAVDEQAMVAQIRRRTLDGAFLTGAGLSAIHPPVQVVELPGLASSWNALSIIRKGLQRDLEKGIETQGFTVLGWGDVGLAYRMSRRQPVRRPRDLKGLKVHRPATDRARSAEAAVLGFKGVRGSVGTLGRALQSGRVQVVTVPAPVAHQRRWPIDHVVQPAVGGRIGAFVISKHAWSKLSRAHRAILTRTAREAAAQLSRASRQQGDRALSALARSAKVARLSRAELGEWRAQWKAVRQRLGRGTFPPALINKAESLAGVR